MRLNVLKVLALEAQRRSMPMRKWIGFLLFSFGLVALVYEGLDAASNATSAVRNALWGGCVAAAATVTKW